MYISDIVVCAMRHDCCISDGGTNYDLITDSKQGTEQLCRIFYNSIHDKDNNINQNPACDVTTAISCAAIMCENSYTARFII